MVSWGLTIIISLVWIVFVYVSFLFLLSHKNKYGLDAIFIFYMVMIIPVLIFVFTNVMCWVNKTNKTAYWVIMIVLSAIFIGGPILYFAGRCAFLLIVYSPKRMAAYARKKVGSFHYYQKKWTTIHRGYKATHEAEQAYITEQLQIIQKKLGNLYRLRSRKGKDRFIRALMNINLKEIPQIADWKYQTVLADLCKAETALLISFKDGKNTTVSLYWPKKDFTTEELMEGDRRKLELEEKFRNITMTGRLIYIFMCIERYLVTMYPEKDWTPVATRMWNRTKEPGRWSEGTPGDLYREIVPERIMRFHKHGYGYEQLNPMVFGKKLSQEDYTLIRGLYEGISKGDPNEEINRIIGLPEKLIYVVDLRRYSFPFSDQMTIESILTAEEILNSHGIALPDYSLLEQFSYNRTSNEMPDKDKDVFFGFGVNADALSILLNKNNQG